MCQVATVSACCMQASPVRSWSCLLRLCVGLARALRTKQSAFPIAFVSLGRRRQRPLLCLMVICGLASQEFVLALPLSPPCAHSHQMNERVGRKNPFLSRTRPGSVQSPERMCARRAANDCTTFANLQKQTSELFLTTFARAQAQSSRSGLRAMAAQ